MDRRKILFISDVHLGSGTNEEQKERLLIEFLKGLMPERVRALYVLGDLFDFWFEYGSVIFSRHFRVLSALAEVVERGIDVHLIVGNHDFWAGDFMKKTIGLKIHPGPVETELDGRRVYMCHGDGLNPHDRSYLVLKAVIRSRPVIWLTRLAHPGLLVWLARQFSKLSRGSVSVAGQIREDDGITRFAMRKLKEGADVVIAAHSHRPHDEAFTVDGVEKHYYNVGDMQERFSYLQYFAGKFTLKHLKPAGSSETSTE